LAVSRMEKMNTDNITREWINLNANGRNDR
jgi:hypothetical protein